MYLEEMGQRGCDTQGCGHYKASRGIRRLHNGVDLCAPINTPIKCGFSGKVVKVGFAYSDSNKSHLRYVAIKLGEYYARVFYIQPLVEVGDIIYSDTIIGSSLSLGEFYRGITEHVHLEMYALKDKNKSIHDKKNFEYIDPSIVLEVLRNN